MIAVSGNDVWIFDEWPFSSVTRSVTGDASGVGVRIDPAGGVSAPRRLTYLLKFASTADNDLDGEASQVMGVSGQL